MVYDVEYKDVLGFEKEPLESPDFSSLAEAVAEARRCLHCAVPQCQKGCPIHNEIPQFIHALVNGNIGEAAEHIRKNSYLPGICGRVCPWEKQCEGSCVLGKRGKHIEIGKLERFVADMCFQGDLLPIPKKQAASIANVAVVGSGPAGLAAAHELINRQYHVSVFESASEPGGMLMYGIPAFRLHKKYVYREIEYLKQLGAEFHFNTKIGSDKSLEELFAEGYEAVFLATGTPLGWNLGVENDEVEGVVDAQHFLTQVLQVQLGEAKPEELPIQPGDNVIVVGAGNVAIDAARTALRLKAKVTIVYRRAEKNMKCLPSEYEAAKADGVAFKFYSAPKAVVGTDHVEGLKYEKQQILEDATMVPTGEFGVVPANKIIAAIGNRPELDCIRQFGIKANDDGYIAAQEIPYGMTSKAGVFAAGDGVHKPATVVLAMREGKKVAAGIDEYIRAKHILAKC